MSGRQRARTVSVRRTSQRLLRQGALLHPSTDDRRPLYRGDCVDGPRPCPWVGCRYHLFLDETGAVGSLKFNHPDREPDELDETCALDVADRGGATLDEIGELMNITRERVRQIETIALTKARLRGGLRLRVLLDEDT
jgi:hypothetical protein